MRLYLNRPMPSDPATNNQQPTPDPDKPIPAENKLVAGDTLFLDSIGRTDLPGGNSRQILRSIHDKLLPLDDAVVVIPGHGANTTIGRERRRNPFLQGM